MPSVLERIAQNVHTTLAGITTGNGYDLTLAVERAQRINDPRHLKAIIFQLSPDDVTAEPINADDHIQSFAVIVYVMPEEGDPTPVDTYNNDVAAAMHKALMADYTRGGLAINTMIRPTLYFPPVEGEFGGISFMFDVLYRHALDNPFLTAI